MAVRHRADDDLRGAALAPPPPRAPRHRSTSACRTCRRRTRGAGRTAPRRRSAALRRPRSRACSASRSGMLHVRVSARVRADARLDAVHGAHPRREAHVVRAVGAGALPRNRAAGDRRRVGRSRARGNRARARFTIHSPMRCGISGDGTIASRAKRDGLAAARAQDSRRRTRSTRQRRSRRDGQRLGASTRVRARPRIRRRDRRRRSASP